MTNFWKIRKIVSSTEILILLLFQPTHLFGEKKKGNKTRYFVYDYLSREQILNTRVTQIRNRQRNSKPRKPKQFGSEPERERTLGRFVFRFCYFYRPRHVERSKVLITKFHYIKWHYRLSIRKCRTKHKKHNVQSNYFQNAGLSW